MNADERRFDFLPHEVGRIKEGASMLMQTDHGPRAAGNAPSLLSPTSWRRESIVRSASSRKSPQDASSFEVGTEKEGDRRSTQIRRG
jgi:hypothetical protein